jgi:hypothetical protein
MLKEHIIKGIFQIIKSKDMEFCIINLVCRLIKDIGKMINFMEEENFLIRTLLQPHNNLILEISIK